MKHRRQKFLMPVDERFPWMRRNVCEPTLQLPQSASRFGWSLEHRGQVHTRILVSEFSKLASSSDLGTLYSCRCFSCIRLTRAKNNFSEFPSTQMGPNADEESDEQSSKALVSSRCILPLTFQLRFCKFSKSPDDSTWLIFLFSSSFFVLRDVADWMSCSWHSMISKKSDSTLAKKGFVCAIATSHRSMTHARQVSVVRAFSHLGHIHGPAKGPAKSAKGLGTAVPCRESYARNLAERSAIGVL